jgi:hypothetical protein
VNIRVIQGAYLLCLYSETYLKRPRLGWSLNGGSLLIVWYSHFWDRTLNTGGRFDCTIIAISDIFRNPYKECFTLPCDILCL